MTKSASKSFKYIFFNQKDMTVTKLKNHFDFPNDVLLQVKQELYDKKLVAYKLDKIILTEKGKSYYLNKINVFIKNNLISILALLISIIALFKK